jgi:hypothetical protein
VEKVEPNQPLRKVEPNQPLRKVEPNKFWFYLFKGKVEPKFCSTFFKVDLCACSCIKSGF